MFFGLLRKSNVFPPSALGLVAAKHLLRKISIAPGPFGFAPCLTDVSLGKEHQFKERKHVAYLPYLPEHPLCPISAIVRAFLVTPIPASFPGPQPFWLTPLLYSKFLSILNSNLKQLYLDSSRFATHSFRRGGATWAFA